MTILDSIFLCNILGEVPRSTILFILYWFPKSIFFLIDFISIIKDGTSGNAPFHSEGRHFGERPSKKTIALLP